MVYFLSQVLLSASILWDSWEYLSRYRVLIRGCGVDRARDGPICTPAAPVVLWVGVRGDTEKLFGLRFFPDHHFRMRWVCLRKTGGVFYSVPMSGKKLLDIMVTP